MEPFRFASRTQWNLTPNEMTRQVAALQRRGVTLQDLTESNPTRCGLEYPTAMIQRALTQKSIVSYDPTPKGLASARLAVSQYLQSKTAAPCDPENLVLTASTSEAYSFLFRLLTEPGDSILVPHPSYPLFDFLGQLNDIDLIPYALEYAAGWHVDDSSLERAVTSKTRAVLVVNPNNPTGSGLPLEERNRLLEFCRQRALALIVDEVFLDFEFATNAPRLKTFAGATETLTFVLNGISKMLGLPQMKLAWIAASGPREWLTPAMERLEVIADTYLSVATPIQLALPSLLAEVRARVQPQILERVRGNLHFLDTCVAGTDGLCRRLVADGGWSAVLSIPRTRSEEEWVLRWLELDHVLVHPGYFFDFQRDGHIVVSLLPPPEIFQDAVQRLMARVLSDCGR